MSIEVIVDDISYISYISTCRVEGDCTGCEASLTLCQSAFNDCSTANIIWIKKKTMQEPKSALDKQVGSNHYKLSGIQPVEYIHANYLNFCEGNVIKYITRHRNKNKEEDVRKALHYCQLILKLEYGLDE